MLRGGVPINTSRKCARAPAHVRAGPRGNALRFHGECALVAGHLRARHVAGENALLDARSAQRTGFKGLASVGPTRNSCPTSGVDATHCKATTCDCWSGQLLDVSKGSWEGPRASGCEPNVFEHTTLAPSRKAVFGRMASRPARIAGRTPGPLRPEGLRGNHSAPSRKVRQTHQLASIATKWCVSLALLVLVHVHNCRSSIR